jgi:hypothetical protein
MRKSIFGKKRVFRSLRKIMFWYGPIGASQFLPRRHTSVARTRRRTHAIDSLGGRHRRPRSRPPSLAISSQPRFEDSDLSVIGAVEFRVFGDG